MTHDPRALRRAVRDVAEEALGFDRLRGGQEEAVRSVLDGHDTLAIMPTGSGKSAIYQIAAVLIPGPTVVVSPLIALQRDQVGAINEMAEEAGDEADDGGEAAPASADAPDAARTTEAAATPLPTRPGTDAGEAVPPEVEVPAEPSVGHAAVVNSNVSEKDRQAALDGLADGSIEFVFLAPEQLDNPDLLARLESAGLSLFVVDEAHCISDWGHDFRPAYLKLGAVIEQLGHPPVLALTATAAPPVREEILERLGMRDPRVVARGFDRPNIWLGAEQFPDERRKQQALLDWITSAEKPGIVYAATRRRVEDLSSALRDRGVDARAYHAGMSAPERHAVQESFMGGETPVMVATTAFGMGVDKPDVRFVAHADVPESLDAYYQEIGRAGRDGEPARALLFYRPEDLSIRRFFAASGKVDVDQLEAVLREVRRSPGPIARAELKRRSGLSQARLTTAISRLEEVGAISVGATSEVSPGEWQGGAGELAAAAGQLEARRRQYERSRIEMMRGYAELRDCRRGYLLNYFGEPYQEPCDNCDNCDRGLTVVEDDTDRPFALNDRVSHPIWGEGLVLRYEGNTIEVLFDSVGYKTLAVDHVLAQGLLSPVR